MGVTQIDTKKMIAEITDELVQKGLTNIKEIKIEPFAIGAYVHANVSVSFYEEKKESHLINTNFLKRKCQSCGCITSVLYISGKGSFCIKCKPSDFE